ncbi:MAG TPA: 1,2-phenylacetyl-CoA epoxidase subunit PaaC [Saprospiraceae bacterium]|nr:1,2-phenylacetyl-CoA epoxidase subunit PaaC [Saprospiraceae bacterium]
MATNQALFQYCLRLGDTNLILGHRLSEMCSRGPMLEEDIALTNFALDHIGQAEALLQYAGKLEGKGRSEDDLSYLRNVEEFENFRLVEQPNTDFAYVIARQFLVDVYQCLLYQKMQKSTDETLAGMGSRFLKESTYHLRHTSGWMERLGLGTDESKRRIQQAINDLWQYTPEMLSARPYEKELTAKGIVPDAEEIALDWLVQVVRVLSRSGIHKPQDAAVPPSDSHSDHLVRMLAEMQYLQRTYPDARW